MIRGSFILLLLVFSFLGCTPSTKETSVLKVSEGASVVDYSTARRGAYVRPAAEDPKKILICAEPPPDVAVGIAANLTAKVSLPQAISPELNASITEQVIDLAKRGQALQIQREALYRLCELHANGVLTNAQVEKMYKEVIDTVKQIALAEKGEAAARLAEAFAPIIVPSSNVESPQGAGAAESPSAASVMPNGMTAEELREFLERFFELEP